MGYDVGSITATDWALFLTMAVALLCSIIATTADKFKDWCSKRSYWRHVPRASLLLAFLVFIIFIILRGTSSQYWILLFAFIGLIFTILLLIDINFFKATKQKVVFILVLAVISIPIGFLILSYTNKLFDSSEPQTFFGTVENRNWKGGRLLTRILTPSYFVYLSIKDSDEVLTLNIDRRLYHSISMGDMVYICKKPGFWGIEWNSCLHRTIRPNETPFNTTFGRRAANHKENQELQIHPDDYAEHIRVLLP